MKVKFHPHPDQEQENVLIREELSKIPGIELETIAEPHDVKEPWIEAPDGWRYYGLAFVQSFVRHRHETLDPLGQLKILVDQLPEGMHADWLGTNHYEIQSTGDDFWWLHIADIFAGWPTAAEDWQATEAGKRLGLILDVAAKVKEIWPYLEKLSKVVPHDPHVTECELALDSPHQGTHVGVAKSE